MRKTRLKQIIIDQQQTFRPNLSSTKREAEKIIEKFLLQPQILILSGIRRCGKSTLLHNIRAHKLQQDYFINFDDDRLIDFQVSDFQTLFESFIELFGEQKHFYFDEIQLIPRWEQFVRRLHDNNYSIFITGSNAAMLSYELGTHLTGRYHQRELFPFSFKEYLSFINYKLPKIYSSIEKSKLQKVFFEYLHQGGFPGYLQNLQPDYLIDLYQSILFRDVVARYKITMINQLKEMVYFIASNIGKCISFSKIKQMLHIGNVSTVKKYFDFLKDAYLVFTVSKFDFSVKRQLLAPKKIYFVDSAMAQIIGFRFSDDLGRILENTVYLQLRRMQKEVFYHAEKKECDFLIRENGHISTAIQVTQDLADAKTKQREIEGLCEAMSLHQLKQGIILTLDEEDHFLVDQYAIDVLPIWKWLLLNS
jgi:predicted AAA+ superfamily ATPase